MMTGNLRLTDFADVISAIKPVTLNTGANVGDVISMKNWMRCAIIFFGTVGSSGTDITLTLEQGTNVAFGTNKALAFTTVFKKEGADLLAIGTMTKVTQAAANTFTFANNEQLDQIYVIDVQAEDLDIANDYDCIRLSVNQGSAAKVGCALYIPYGPRYGKEVELSSIID